ncbi:MAG: SURF1 family protein [Xanthomonadales bacterium]|nr:SURF1 family protein [Xanthomonadales bacterium]
MILTLLAVLVVAGFTRLGFWQLERAAWKTDWLAQWQAAEEAAPRAISAVDLADKPSAAALVRHVSIQGRWDEQLLILLDNRIRDGKVGFEFYRILYAPDLPVALLVDLGWHAWPARRELPSVDALRSASRLDSDLRLSGLLLPWPGQGLAVGEAGSADAQGRLLLSRLDRDAIRAAWLADDSRQLVLANAVLKLDPSIPLGFTRDAQALPNTLPPERHKGYAVQWFALALAVTLIYGVLMWRNILKHRHHGTTPA